MHFHTLRHYATLQILTALMSTFSSELLHLHWVWQTLKRPGKSWEGYYQRNIIFTFNISVSSENFIIIEAIWSFQQGATSYDRIHTDRTLNTVHLLYSNDWNYHFPYFYTVKSIKKRGSNTSKYQFVHDRCILLTAKNMDNIPSFKCFFNTSNIFIPKGEKSMMSSSIECLRSTLPALMWAKALVGVATIMSGFSINIGLFYKEINQTTLKLNENIKLLNDSVCTVKCQGL